MECKTCKTEKLPNEFPPDALTDACQHPVQICLRCTVKHVAETGVCSHPDCNQTVAKDNQRLNFFKAMLNEMFREYNESDGYQAENVQLPTTDMLYITLLTGDYMSVVYQADQTIRDLKMEIMKETKHEPDKQKLLYMDEELQDFHEEKLARLSDFQVKPNSSLCLVIRLFAIPNSFDKVVFDLHWGYPKSGIKDFFRKRTRDYLDATCFLYEGEMLRYLCDYTRRNPIPAIHHSGDKMDDKRSIGHHTIEVYLKQMPHNINSLYFTLSAWNSPSIARYTNPSLKFYDGNEPTIDLCKTTFTHAGHAEAVIMCSVIRNTYGSWEIYQSGICSGGNAKSYAPLMKTIEGEIKAGH